MMESKLFEIRDAATFIPILCVLMDPKSPMIHIEGRQRWLLSRAGYGTPTVLMVEINGGSGRSECDPYGHGRSNRTYAVAHEYIIWHLSELKSGDVIDVEFILGESKIPKRSEQFDVEPHQ